MKYCLGNISFQLFVSSMTNVYALMGSRVQTSFAEVVLKRDTVNQIYR